MILFSDFLEITCRVSKGNMCDSEFLNKQNSAFFKCELNDNNERLQYENLKIKGFLQKCFTKCISLKRS